MCSPALALSQRQEDGSVHPVAYASRALSPTEKGYRITELKTLAVVWAVSHFHYYLYGHNVTIYTDHTIVKAVLEKPNSSGKHARWWSRVYGSGIKQVSITYRAGRENCNADTLLWHPQPTCLVSDDDEEVVQIAAIRDTNSFFLDEISSLLMQYPLAKSQSTLLLSRVRILN